MHAGYPPRYTPTSPLSPRMSAETGRLSPTASRQTTGQPKTAPRKFPMQPPLWGPNYGDRSGSVSPTSRVQSPALSLSRVPQTNPMDLQRTMGKGQRELIRQLRLSSQLAASPLAHRPDAPRLDPLGSPKGAVTPLALEQQEAKDYFAFVGVTKYSPMTSPGGHNSRNDTADKEKQMKKMEFYI